MQILVIGNGSVGKRHATNLHSLGCTIGVVDPREDRRNELDFPKARYASHRDALDDGSFDGVVIATPPAFHVEQAFDCADIPILMEKNLCLLEDLEQAEEMVEAREKPALMGYTWRWNDTLQKTLIDEIAPLRRVSFVMAAHLADWHPWEPVEEFYAAERGGIVNEAHWHDIMLHWFGWPHKLFAATSHISDLNIPSDDVLDALFFYDGFRVNMHYDLYQRPHERSMTLVGEKGTIIWTPESTVINGELRFNPYDRNTMFLKEASEFLSVVEGKPPCCTLKDGLNVMRLLEDSAHSWHTGTLV